MKRELLRWNDFQNEAEELPLGVLFFTIKALFFFNGKLRIQYLSIQLDRRLKALYTHCPIHPWTLFLFSSMFALLLVIILY